MSSKDFNNYSDNSNTNQYNYNYNNINYNNYNNNNFNNYNNNNYNKNYYNNRNYNSNYNYNYGNIINYHNNYPVYSTIPASTYLSSQSNEGQSNYSNNESDLKKETSLSYPTETKEGRGIMIKIKPEDMCYLRPPEYAPGYIGQMTGIPSYAKKNSNT